MTPRPIVFLLPLFLAACGDLPEPFIGNPGATARRLAMPVAPMLAVPAPEALLPAAASQDFADLLALALQREEITALARPKRKEDWALAISASEHGDKVVLRYAILDPRGRELGAIEGAALAANAWKAGWPPTLGQAGKDAVPKILALMNSIKATRDRANPDSLLNRIPRLFVPDVAGAPGDGNQALSRLIRDRLREFGPIVQTTPDGADFIVRGTVTATPIPKGQQRIEIVWTVTRPGGDVSGKVAQLNAIPAGTLNGAWGEVAAAVTREAAGGINTVVERYAGRDPNQPKEVKATDPAKTPATR